MESMEKVEFPVSSEVEWGGLHGLQVELEKNLAGLSAKEIPGGLQVDSRWTRGVHVE